MFENFPNEFPDFPIGTFNLDEDDTLNEEQIVVGDIGKKAGTCLIEVFPTEGKFIPHVHVHNADKSFQACVRLDVPEYFKHNAYKDEFNSKQKKKFNEIMHMTTYYDPDHNYWESACITWNKNYAKYPVDFKKIGDIDYTKL